MNSPRKNRIAFYGIIVSAAHFTAAALFSKTLPLLMLRFEDMIGSGDTKPYWPASRLRDLVQGVGDVLSLPGRLLYDRCPNIPDLLTVFVVVLNSCLWGFGLALLGHLLFTRLRVSHAPRPA